MTKKEQLEKSTILLVRLYNRLSYYFMTPDQAVKDIMVKDSTTIDELQKLLNEFYDKEEARQKELENKPKLKYKNKQA